MGLRTLYGSGSRRLALTGAFRGRSARVIGIIGIGAIAAGAVWVMTRRDRFALPARLHVEEVVQEFSAAASDPPAQVGWIQPSQSFHADGGYRQAILASPPSLLRYRLHPPADAVLRLAFGVQKAAKRDAVTAGIRFVVSVNGREVLSRVLNPATTRRDRRWFEEAIDMGALAGRDVELTLRTERSGSHGELAGTSGWTDLRLVQATWHERQPATPSAPSVLLVLVDALRADRLGCYGATSSPSPTLDRLAGRGILFRTMVAQSSWTLPSTATIMTGLHPRDHGLQGWGAGALSNAFPTVAERAAAAGITTFGVSANPLVSRRTNFARGFETFIDYSWDERRENWAPARDVNGPFLRWLEHNRGRRFLAYLHYMEPHDPYTPPPAFRPAAADGVRSEIAAGRIVGLARKIGRGRAALSEPEVAHLRALYDGEIRAWDDALSEILAALARLGLEDSTVVAVTADHGEEFMEHERLTHGSHLYEESIRVPLVIAGPSISPARVDEQAQAIDLFPTIAALLGFAPPAGLSGRNLLDAHPSEPVFSETHHGVAPDGSDMQVVAVRTPGWKLVHTPLLGRFELYDLVHDPTERENVFGAAQESGAVLDLLARWEAAAPSPPDVGGPDPALRERLRALGYVD